MFAFMTRLDKRNILSKLVHYSLGHLSPVLLHVNIDQIIRRKDILNFSPLCEMFSMKVSAIIVGVSANRVQT